MERPFSAPPIGHNHHLDLRVELHDSPFGYASSDSSSALSGEMSGDACVVVKNIRRGSGSRQVCCPFPASHHRAHSAHITITQA